MMSETQSRKIVKYRKLAQKNVFCKYLATLLLVCDVIVLKIFSYNKRRFIVLGQFCLVTVMFLFNTSFSPQTFAEVSEENLVPEETNVMEETLAYSDEGLAEHVEDAYAVAGEENVAGLDDLIEKSKDVTAEESAVALMTDSEMGLGGEKTGFEETVVFNKDDWKLLLINKQRTIPEDYEFTLGTIKGTMRCDERIIEPLTQMFAAAKADGVDLVVRSPYRDMKRQEYLFERKIKMFQASGMSYMDAYKTASVMVTVPGASEHQVGLALDITSNSYPVLEKGFADTEGGKWLAEHSWEYGFILRYPLGKEHVTGIQFEPWHFRYVGVDAAEVITKENITLEEFVENL